MTSAYCAKDNSHCSKFAVCMFFVVWVSLGIFFQCVGGAIIRSVLVWKE